VERPNIQIIFICLWLVPAVFISRDTRALENAGWVLEKDENHIACYTRVVPGSDFREYKAVTVVQSTLTGLVALVADMEKAPQWIDTCMEGQVLERMSDNESITYSANSAPWPVSDRDAVVHNTVHQDKETYQVTIRMSAKPEYIPERQGRVRIKFLKGFWQFTPDKDGAVSVHYQVHCEPGGVLPAWLVKAAVVDQPYNTLLNMQTYVLKKEYHEKRYAFIKEVFDSK